MTALFFLIPISLILVGVAIYFFCWSVNSGQYQDLERSAYQVLEDDEQDGLDNR